MSREDEVHVAALVGTVLSLAFRDKKLDLEGWGEADSYCELPGERYVVVEVEASQKHPTTNIAKLWPWLDARPKARVLFIHAIIDPNPIPKNRLRLAAWLGQRMEREYRGRFAYRRLVIRNGTIQQGLTEVLRGREEVIG
jgi:hypothetical protein